MNNYCGYNFTKKNGGGLGAIIYNVLLNRYFSKKSNYDFCFTKEGYDIPRLNGSIDDIKEINTTKYWHSYFSSFNNLRSEEDCEILLHNNNQIKYGNDPINEFSYVLKNEIFILQPEFEKKVNELVSKTDFCKETDLVLHIRRTDKHTEVDFLPLETYIYEVEYALKKYDYLKRIYICTDDQSTCEYFKKYFNNHIIDVIWDNAESLEPLQEYRFHNKLPKSEAIKETDNAFKNLYIMKNAQVLIGGRMSYFFRIAELLRYPNITINIQDSKQFGIAEYSEVNYMVRSLKDKNIKNFINPKFSENNELILKYNNIYKNTNNVNINNFIDNDFCIKVRSEIETYKWWSYAITPNNGVWKAEHYHNLDTIDLKDRFSECNDNLVKKNFSYRFKRQIGGHYASCNCITCRLYDTVRSYPVTDLLCKIVGCRNMTPNEIFLSNYSNGDFLNIHHDKSNGDIAVTFSFTYDWHPTYGGILNFCDHENNIYKSIVPNLGSVNIFKIDPLNETYHFVSNVVVDKNRYTLIAWYNLIY